MSDDKCHRSQLNVLTLNVFDDKNLEVKHLVSNVLATNVIGVKELESIPLWIFILIQPYR